jgi:hypothetical protein
MLHDEIDTHTQHAAKRKQKALVRLNVVSDIPYESLHPEIFSQHPSVQFYDYTKIAGRVLKPDGSPRQLPPNYHLTLSSSGITGEESNWEDVRTHLNNGGVASMVFDVGKTGKLPTHVHDEETGVKYRVIDGDLHDHRHQDHAFNNINPKEGVIAGLKFKGSEEKAESATHFNVKVPVDKDHVSVPPANKRQKE